MTTIKLKNGSGAPLAGDLVQGEPALDLTNKRLYTEDSGGTVIEVGTNPGEDVTFADNRKAIFGAGSDLKIYHDGSDSYIDDTGTGRLRLRGAADIILAHPTNGETYATFSANGANTFYYNNSAKLATTNTGIDVTGTVTADGLTSDGNVSVAGAGNTRTIGFDFYGSSKYNFHVDGATDADKMFVRRGTTNVATFDSSGNLLVGTTSTAVAALTSGGGSVISSAGATAIAYQSVNATDPVFLLNNTGVDGSIAEFRKDGTAVGSIGTVAGDMFLGTTSTGVRFLDANNEIIPITVSSGGGSTDGTISLGGSPYRFKDLYLSGGVYLGGTGSANKLDDYEEGTWIPGAGNQTVVGDFTSSGTYTKVGRVVTVTAVLTATTSIAGGAGSFFTGLPFSPSVVAGGVLVLNNRSSACWVQNFPTTTNVYINTGYSAHPQVEVTLTYIT